MVLSLEEKRVIEEQGYGKSGDIGGQPKQTYWTPDGRQIFAMPDIHEYSKRSNGKVVENGLRDANLDKEWLLTKPEQLQSYCPHCDKWHPTQEEVEQCGMRKNRLDKKWEAQAQKEVKGDDRIGQLETEMSEIKDLLKQLVQKGV